MADASRLPMFAPQLQDEDYASSILGDDPMLQLVQEGGAGARQQPAPRIQNVPALPGERRAVPAPKVAPAPAPKAAPAAPEEDYAGRILGRPSQADQSQVTSRLSRQKRDGDMRGAVQRYVEGYQDPAYADVPGFDWDKTGVNIGSSFLAKMTAPNDEAYADIIKSQLGTNFIGLRRDKHGQPLVEYRDADGNQQLRYVNRPGLDLQDVERGVFGAVPYAIGGGVVGGLQKGAGLLANVAGQTAAAGATSMGANAGARALGSNQPVNLAQTGLTAGMGGAGALLARPVGAIDRSLRQVPQLVDGAGNLTPMGINAARAAGLDPSAMSANVAREFAQTYAKTKSATEAAVKGTTAEYNIPISRGQLTKDPDQLRLEEEFRRNIHGRETQRVMQQHDANQAQAIAEAALGGGKGPSIAPMLNPNRGLVDQGVDTLGEGIRGGLATAKQEGREASKAAFKAAGDIIPPPQALRDLPAAIQARVGSFPINPRQHPTAAQMDEMISAFIEGRTLDPGLKVISGRPAGSVGSDEFRKSLFQAYQGATPGADKTAAGLVYKGYDDWLQQMSDKAIAAGNPQFAALNRTARDAHRSLMEAFEPRADGKKLPAANVIGKVLKPGTSATEVVQTLFGAPGLKSAPKEGSVQALENIKRALHTWGDGKGGARSQTWDDVRLAYWMRLVQNKQGEVVTPGVMLNNIQNALNSQREVMRTLYSGEEMGAMIRFATALRHASYKDPNPSGTSYALAGMVKNLSNTIIRGLAWQGNGPLGLALSSALTPLRNVVSAQGARRAVNPGSARIVDPPLGPYAAGITQGALRTDLGGSD